MRILVTGAAGFVGGHLIRELTSAGHTPIQFDCQGLDPAHPDTVLGDLRDAEALTRLVRETRPDGAVHLAGMAFVPAAWEDPVMVYDINTLGAIRLTEAFRKEAPEARVILVTSSEVYGQKSRTDKIREDASLAPTTPYGVSKAAADATALLFAKKYNQPLMTARPQNHIGPGQSDRFVMPAFARQLIQIANGDSEPVMRVGNLESQRAFLDVRDVVRAYRLMLEKGTPGEAYNIASGNLMTIQTALDLLCDIVGVTPTIETDPALYRPTDAQPLVATDKLTADTGWKPEIPLEQTLRDIVKSLS